MGDNAGQQNKRSSSCGLGLPRVNDWFSQPCDCLGSQVFNYEAVIILHGMTLFLWLSIYNAYYGVIHCLKVAGSVLYAEQIANALA